MLNKLKYVIYCLYLIEAYYYVEYCCWEKEIKKNFLF